LGASAVTAYAVCIQMCEPLFGMTASGMSFFFPYLSGRLAVSNEYALRRDVLKAFLWNAGIVGAGAFGLFIFGQRLLFMWTGSTVARAAAPFLPWIILSSSLSGLSVTGTYAMQALGQFREAAVISLGTRTVLLAVMIYLFHRSGIHGLAVTRLLYGAAALLIYVPLLYRFANRRGWGLNDNSWLAGKPEGGVEP
jgi:O-antigen/teichoic acid export membrane protein